MKTYLKIKIKSLAAEAKIIKQEERKWKEVPFYNENVKSTHPLYFGLHQHRIEVVRKECRSAIIAYGYLRGRAYKQIENKSHILPDYERIVTIIRHFSYNSFPDLHVPAKKQEAIEKIKTWTNAPLTQ